MAAKDDNAKVLEEYPTRPSSSPQTEYPHQFPWPKANRHVDTFRKSEGIFDSVLFFLSSVF
jgi:hypothetical protein